MKFLLPISIYCLAVFIIFVNCSGDEIERSPTPLQDFATPFNFGSYNIPEDNPLTEEGVMLGRRLFYEVRLSKDNTVSCASCHEQSRAFTDGKSVSEGINGNKVTKNGMSIVNLLWSSKFFWDGRANSLEEQALQPIENPNEMGLPIEEAVQRLRSIPEYRDLFAKAFNIKTIEKEHIAKALAQFQRTLVSQDSRYDQFLQTGTGFTDQEIHGLRLFFTHPDALNGIRGGNCFDCHRAILTDGFNSGYDGFRNNGLDPDEELDDGLESVTGKQSDRGKMKVPSLRNIELTSPYMHDGRFETLEEVLDHYNEGVVDSETLDPLIRNASNNFDDEGIKLGLTQEEKEAIIAFLLTLTDGKFISNETYSNPFKN